MFRQKSSTDAGSLLARTRTLRGERLAGFDRSPHGREDDPQRTVIAARQDEIGRVGRGRASWRARHPGRSQAPGSKCCSQLAIVPSSPVVLAVASRASKIRLRATAISARMGRVQPEDLLPRGLVRRRLGGIDSFAGSRPKAVEAGHVAHITEAPEPVAEPLLDSLHRRSASRGRPIRRRTCRRDRLRPMAWDRAGCCPVRRSRSPGPGDGRRCGRRSPRSPRPPPDRIGPGPSPCKAEGAKVPLGFRPIGLIIEQRPGRRS